MLCPYAWATDQEENDDIKRKNVGCDRVPKADYIPCSFMLFFNERRRCSGPISPRNSSYHFSLRNGDAGKPSRL